MLKKLTPNLMVEDIGGTIDFYRNVLGFEPVAAVPEEAPFDWALVKSGDVEIMIQSRPSLAAEIPDLGDLEIGATLTFYIEMEGVEKRYEELKDRVSVVQNLHKAFYGMTEFAFRDCNGYILTFAERCENE